MSAISCPTNVPPAFAKLTKAQKRVAIAKDAIKQLRDKQLIATTGVFVYLKSGRPDSGEKLAAVVKQNPALTVKQLLAEQEIKTCEVCALGAVMMAQFRVNGDCKVDAFGFSNDECVPPKLTPYTRASWDTGHGSVFSPFVLSYFTTTQLQLIEIAFELGEGALNCADAVETHNDYGERDEFDDWAAEEKTAVTLAAATRAVAFGKKHKNDDEKRLIAIMTNIVAHHGTFKP